MLDEIDKKILALLQKNCEISNQELADAVALSPSPCLRRVKQLKEMGYIDKQVAILNHKKLGLHLVILLSVSLSSHSQTNMHAFEKAIKKLPEIIECYLITGQTADYILKVMVPTLDDYHNFLLKKLNAIEGVNGMHSSFVLQNIIHKTELPLSHIPKAFEN